MKGRIIRSGKREFLVKTDSGDEVYASALATLIKGRGKHLVVGDYVGITSEGEQFVINEVFERKNEISRRLPRTNEEKVIAANCDLAVIVVSCSLPKYKRGLVERYLLRCERWKVPAVVVFNKYDELDKELDLNREREYLNYFDAPSLIVSALWTKEDKETEETKAGIEKLKEMILAKTSILVGSSGVGKSKLISSFFGDEVELLSGDLAKVGKGAHTTTWAELIYVKDMAIIDSPGVRSFAIDDLSIEDLEKGYSEILRLSVNCKFKDCDHGEKTKGCYFTSLNDEILEDQFLKERLKSYLQIKEEIEKTPHWQRG